MGDIHQWLAANDNRKRDVVGPLASIHDDHARLDTAGPLAAMHDSLAKNMGLFNKLPEMANPSNRGGLANSDSGISGKPA